MGYVLHLITLIAIYVPMAVSLNLVLGYAGLLSVGHVAFCSLGAYATSLLMLRLGWPFPLAVFGALLLCLVLGRGIGALACRLRDDYFVLASLAFLALTYALLHNWVELTNGPYGITEIPRPSAGGVGADGPWAFAALAVLCAGACVCLMWRIARSPFGRALKAVRDNETAAQALGKKTPVLKAQAFSISGGVAALTGVMYASYMGYVDPTVFDTDLAILALAMVLTGGSGNMMGPVVGTLVVVVVPEALRFFVLPSTAAPQVRQIIFGLALVLMVRLRPSGLCGEYRLQ